MGDNKDREGNRKQGTISDNGGREEEGGSFILQQQWKDKKGGGGGIKARTKIVEQIRRQQEHRVEKWKKVNKLRKKEKGDSKMSKG